MSSLLDKIKRTFHDPRVPNSLSVFHTSKKAQWVEQFSGSLNDATQITGTDCLSTYKDERIKNVNGFASIVVGNSTVGAKLAVPAAEEVRRELEKALDLSQSPKAADIEKIGHDLNNLRNIITTQPGKYHYGTIGSQLLEIRGEALGALQAQHDHDKQKLNAKFDEPAFQAQLKASLECTDSQFTTIRNEMMGKLEQSQRDENAKLEKALTDSANANFERLKASFYLISFLGDRYTRDSKMRAEMMKLGPDVADNPTAEYNYDTGDARLKGIQIKDLKTIRTITGRDISANPDGTFSMRLNRLFQTDQSIYKDLTSLADVIKAAGYESITLNIACKDPKKADELGRKAVEAAVRAGFDPKKITINVNGELKYAYNEQGKAEKEELFKNRPERLKQIESLAQQTAKNLQEKIEKKTIQSNELKEELQKLQPAAAPAPEEEGAAPAPEEGGVGADEEHEAPAPGS